MNQDNISFGQSITNSGYCSKGVMLCSRPFDAYNFSVIEKRPTNNDCEKKKYTSLQQSENKDIKYNSDSSEGTSSFICGTVPKPWGSNVIIAEKSRVLSRLSKKDGALSKHKKWLHDMQEEREQRRKEREMETQIKLQKKSDFMKRQSKKRMEARMETKESQIDDKEYSLGKSDIINESTGYKENVAPENHNITDHASTNYLTEKEQSSTCMMKNDKKKPAWAMTETCSQQVQKEIEDQEEADLLDFVDSLGDFDRDFEDMELNMLMRQVKERIRTLTKEKKKDEAKLQTVMESEVAAIKSEACNKNASSKNQFNTSCHEEIGSDENYMADDFDDVRSIAESLRHEVNDIGSIHSQRSIHALVSKSKADLRFCGGEKSMDPPKIITHVEDDGTRIAETKSLNKLPFKNRNPAL